LSVQIKAHLNQSDKPVLRDYGVSRLGAEICKAVGCICLYVITTYVNIYTYAINISTDTSILSPWVLKSMNIIYNHKTQSKA